MYEDICLLSATDNFCIVDIDNRRFMVNPKTGTFVFGKDNELDGSHAEEFSHTGCKENFDDFVRGWIGFGRDYPNGIIHFAPNIPSQCVWLFERGYDVLELFSSHGAPGNCIVRGFGNVWEQPLGEIIAA